jgi:MYXO-CTERM domain-containing protein
LKEDEMRISIGLAATVASVIAAMWSGSASAQVITQWHFETTGVQAAPYMNPLPTTGSGSAKMLGMTNSYNGGNVDSGDILVTAGTANTLFNETTWRIRGSTHNGWATHAAGAPQYSQGVELDASTVGYQNIMFAFDWYSTTQGIRDLQFQYNTDVSNAGGWTNFGGTSPTGTYIATSNDFYNAPNSPTITVNLSSVPGANNDANFGVRLVAAFDSTGNIPNDFASAALNAGTGQTIIYNNNSGNWRFDNLTFSGTVIPTPEPGLLTLFGVGLAGLLIRRRRTA